MSLRTFVRICDSISDWVGRTFAWVAVPIAILVLYEVISRRIFNNPHLWALDSATLLYAIHFMIVGAYGLLHNSHVNIDTIYVYLPRRWQAGLDSAGYLLLFFPYFFIFLYAGMDLAAESIAAGDRTVTGVPIIVPVMKTLMPLCSFFMLLQGLAQFVRSVHLCISGREL
ncbi:MAG: TRAP transporter small permease subunit [Deltaproteobacteria bacterium]|jgi:TRAP-type mannitol/chloroaromatic compound transport system permease small subunit|nr:TRAP transporter small permease subunit [Deltaproteobacteria bacterium]